MQGGDQVEDKMVRAMIISVIIMFCAGGIILLVYDDMSTGIFLIVVSLALSFVKDDIEGEE